MATRQEEIIVKLGADTKELQKELGMTRKQVAAFSRDIQNDLANGYMPETWKLHAKYQDKLREGLEKTKFGFKSMGMAATDTFKALAAGASSTDVIGAGLQRMIIGLSGATGGFAAMGVAAVVGIGEAINAVVNSYYDVDNKAGRGYEIRRRAIRKALEEDRADDAEYAAKEAAAIKQEADIANLNAALEKQAGEQRRAGLTTEKAILKDLIAEKEKSVKLAESEFNFATGSGDPLKVLKAKFKLQDETFALQQAQLKLTQTTAAAEENYNRAIAYNIAQRKKQQEELRNAESAMTGGKLTVGELAAGVADRKGNLIQGRFAGVAQDIQDLDVDRRQALNFGEIDYAKELQAKITDMKEKLYEAGVIEKPVELKMEEHLAEIRKGVTVKPTE
jgi:hypothetical protein